MLKSKFVGASNHHEMARYDLPTYVIYVSGHFWMFAVRITEWVFSPTHSLGQSPKKKRYFFDTFPKINLEKYAAG